MTLKEAENIIELYHFNEDKCCTCFQGNAPCGYCETCPTEEDYLDALKVMEKYV